MLSLFVLNILLYICPVLVSSQAAASIAYTPIVAPCPPGTQLTRNAGLYNQSLSPQEAAYISARQREVLPDAWASYLNSVYRTVSLSLPSYVYDILGGHYGIEAFQS
ncbi:hypothetical protein A0H81_08455 [Grifola frondosa]|uniref:Uncharacterized protein n=1 Tax=Grifola frondosa TaxID=5627 RepID=A0A1C7M3D1_GRIFR|nr:hypothetical protein A0H81_08455 [Grifola frondosa]